MAIPGWAVLKAAAMGYWADNALSRGAAIAYFTIFSIAPVLFIAIALAGLVFGRDAAEGAIVGQLSGLMGHQSASALQGMIRGAYHQHSSVRATAVGLVVLLVTASGAFGEMQSALNDIWKAQPSASTVSQLVRARLISIGLVLTLGFVLLVSLAINAVLSAFGSRIERLLPGFQYALRAIDFGVSLLLIAALLAAIYKVLPDKGIAWRDVGIGAVVTAVLFSIGKYLIGLYIGSTAISSSYGAAGALMVILLWIYYTAQIFLFGAEFTKAYAEQRGSKAGFRSR